jgi:hypothetical protein
MQKQPHGKQSENKKLGTKDAELKHGTTSPPKEVKSKNEQEKLQSHTKNATSPVFRNAITGWEWARRDLGKLDLKTVFDELAAQAKAVNDGDLKKCEAMLVAQVNSLDVIYAELARISLVNVRGGYLDAADRYLRLGFKAQSQCRATVEALAELKNPRQVAFVKQANIAGGNQQVNNAPLTSPSDMRARTEENKSRPNKLLLERTNATVDIGGTGTASCANTQLAAVAKIDRAENKKW